MPSQCDFLKLYGIDVVLFQESNTIFFSESFLHSIGEFLITCWRHLNSMGASLGQLIGWHDFVFDCSSELVGEFFLLAKLTNRKIRQHFVITSVYGLCGGASRRFG